MSFEAVVAPHCATSRAVPPGTWLVLNDTTEIDFGYDRLLEGVGRVGSRQARGFMTTRLLEHPLVKVQQRRLRRKGKW